MRERTLLKIGEFARVGQVSIATLRHYEKVGLLQPTALDPDTGYRYYSLDQLQRLNRILALKDLGFPLEQIMQLLASDLPVDQLRGMFALKQTQTQQMIAREQARLTRIAARLRQIEQEGIMPVYEVILKHVEPLRIASLRTLVPMGEDLRKGHETLIADLDQQWDSTQPPILLFHSRYAWHGDTMAIDVEAAIPLTTEMPNNERISTRTLPGGLMACSVHAGVDLALGQAHAALHRWIKDNGYQIVGLPRHVYLQRMVLLESDQFVTELQFPVKEG